MNQWISVKERLPEHGSMVLIAFGENRMIAVARYFMTSERRWLDACYGREEYAPDFWQPLPEPPPKPDPFEEWWKTNHSLPCIADIRWVVRPDSSSALGSSSKDVAKVIWDAAIESFNREAQDNIQAQLHETLCQPRNPQNT